MVPVADNTQDIATKADEEKIRMDLIPPRALRYVADVFTYGAKKYSAHNWEKGLDWSRLYAALQRHLTAFWAGEDWDVESHRHHLAHAACNCLMLLHEVLERPELDDRSYKRKAEEEA